MYFKLSECFKIKNLKEVFVEISTKYPQLKSEFVKIMNYRDSKLDVAFLFENSKIFIEENLAVKQSDAYPAILLLVQKNYFAIEESILNQPDTLEGLSETDMQYIIGNEWKSPVMLKDVDLQTLFDENKLHGCTDIKAVLRAI